MKRFCVLLMALMMAGAALAETSAPVAYSARFLAVSAAQHALAEKYFIAEGMNEYFSRTVTESADGGYVILWEPAFGDSPMSWLLGTYTASVSGDDVDIKWTHDGEETYGGYTAEAWGAAQLRQMAEEVRTDFDMSESWSAAARTVYGGREDAYPFELAEQGFDNSEESRAAALALAAITPEEGEAAARMALRDTYGALEWERLETDDAEFGWNIGLLCGRPVMIVHYDLWGQGRADWTWQEGDGVYEVTVNLATGEIEEILYGNGLSGNG